MIKSFYRVFCRVEEAIAGILLGIIAILVFTAAMARTAGYPINWAMDVSLLLFAWEVFLGGDIAIRSRKLVNVDMFINRLPCKMQKIISLIFAFLILAFLLVLVRYGIPLCLESVKRLFQTLPISYAWCTLAVPLSAIFMIISQIIIVIEDIKKPSDKWGR